MGHKRKSKESYEDCFKINPKTKAQKELLKALHYSSQTFVFGHAGTGKTYVIASVASQLYKNGFIDRIIITRPNVEAGRPIGHLPGYLDEKMLPWGQPVLEVLYEHLGKSQVENDIKNGKIEIIPLALMRGRSFKDSFVICDESQNTTIHELKMLLTRVGEGSKIAINGDVSQHDLQDESGLAILLDIIEDNDLDVPLIEFEMEDCVRGDVCKQWIEIFDKENIQ